MNVVQRWLVWGSSLLTGLTGLAYAWIKYLMEPAGPWAVINHPLQPWLLKAHILVAPVMVFAVGLITAEHIWTHLRARVKAGRRSGLTVLWVFVPMVFSGYLIQAVTHAGWLTVLVWVHLGTGILYLLGLLFHHRVFRRNGVARKTEGEPGPGEDGGPSDGGPSGGMVGAAPPGDVRRRGGPRKRRTEVPPPRLNPSSGPPPDRRRARSGRRS